MQTRLHTKRIRLCSGGIPGGKGCEGRWRKTKPCTMSQSCKAVDDSKSERTYGKDEDIQSGDTGCFDPSDLNSYRGTKKKTISGVKCQKWKLDEPWPHDYKPDKYPEAGLKKNYCRNPDNDVRPWCFTQDVYLEWDYCNVKKCKDTVVQTTTPESTTPEGATTPSPPSDECGIPDISMSSQRKYKSKSAEHIVGGFQTNEGSIPWQVSLQTKYNERHFCGGSLYTKRWVITAAHCVADMRIPSAYYVMLGNHLLSEIDVGEKRVDISAIRVHPDYNNYSLKNDIALLKLTESVTFSTYIKPICLPTADAIPVTNDEAFVSGWGDTLISNQGLSNVLMQVSVPIVENSKCKKLLDGVKWHMVCAGIISEGGKDSCQGDSGGPLFMKNDAGKYELIGIVSWGIGCAEKYKPGVYTRVSHYIDWIENIAS